MTGTRLGPLPGALIAAAALIAMSGCAGAATHPSPSRSASASPSDSSADRGAAVELARFDAVNRATIAAHPAATGDDLIAGLTSAGYPIAALEMTPDATSIGLAAPSLQFAARTDTGCLIGQLLPDGKYLSSAAPLRSTGTCLIGATRALR